MKKSTAVLIIFVLWAALGSLSSAAAEQALAPQPENPFFKPYQTPFNVPPFGLIKNEHFLPAILEGIKRHEAEIEAIITNPQAPTFENTIVPLDGSGIFLSEVTAVFGALQGADTSPQLQALARQTAPLLAAHNDNINLNEKLFQRIKAVYDKRASLNLTSFTCWRTPTGISFAAGPCSTRNRRLG
jgi:peptidyl-dipeptidase Dcp